MANPVNFLREISPNPRHMNQIANRVGMQRTSFSYKTIIIFNGIVEIDKSFKNHLKTQIVKLITKSLKTVAYQVETRIQEQRKIAESKDIVSFSVMKQISTVIIDEM